VNSVNCVGRESLRIVPPAVAADHVLRLLGHEADHERNRSDRWNRLRAAGFELSAFQQDAVERAEEILTARGGVLIADSVGLGKTFVALGLIDRCVGRGMRTVVVTAPAALRSHWLRPLRRLASVLGVAFIPKVRTSPGTRITGAEIGTAGSRPDARGADGVSATPGWMIFRSHTALAIDGGAAFAEMPDLIVVDESHAFRNPNTQRARALARVCGRGHVVLISATPINNSLMDLHAQLCVFLGDGALADIGVPDLRSTFRSARESARDPKLGRAIAAVTVRRTRAVLMARYRDDPMLRFPERAPPVPVIHDPGGTADAIDAIGRLELKPFLLRPSGKRVRVAASGPELLRYILLKRLESGSAAFRRTVRSLLQFLVAFEGAAMTKRLLTAREHRAGGSDGDQLMLEPLLLGPWPSQLPLDEWCRSVRNDVARLRSLESALEREDDSKIRALAQLLGGPLAGTKVLVFTEFRDTAAQLHRALRNRPGIARIDGGGAWVASGRASRAAVIAAFSPRSNGSAAPSERERIDVLISTDVLSEGLDLQDAGVVVSYDLPWNPVRLIQRIGRIDRLGSRHSVIRTYCFVPGPALDAMLGLLGRIDSKLAQIRQGLGPGDSLSSLSTLASRSARKDDQSRATVGLTDTTRVQEQVNERCAASTQSSRRLMHDAARNAGRRTALSGLQASTSAVTAAILRSEPGLFDAIEREYDQATLSDATAPPCDTQPAPERDAFEDRFEWIVARGPAAIALTEPPFGAVVCHTAIRDPHFLLCVVQGNKLRFARRDRDGQPIVHDTRMLDFLNELVDPRGKSAAVRPPVDGVSLSPPGLAADAGQTFDYASLVRALQACNTDPEQAAEGKDVRRIARRIARLAAAVPGGLDASACGRVDGILRQLRCGCRRGLEMRLNAIVRKPISGGPRSQRVLPAGAFHELLAGIEAALAESATASIPGERLVAAFDLRPVAIEPA
jgi:superfamily II DNA or RNA helicase